MATSPIMEMSARSPEMADRRFHMAMALAMAFTIVAGFSLHLAMGRSSFAVPPIFHIHAFVSFTWIGLYLAQSILIAGNNAAWHRRLGMVAFGWVPLMVAVGLMLIVTVMQRTGGPFFFDQNQFLFSNPAHLLCFAGLTFAALKVRRHAGWHRRLMLVGFAILTGPGLGRLLPMPLAMPHAWHVNLAIVLIWPAIGMIRDRMVTGRIHPAWLWGIGTLLALQVLADLVAYSDFGIAFTQQFVAGTPGADRPMEAFMPPGMAM
jgi:hypothetical protein